MTKRKPIANTILFVLAVITFVIEIFTSIPIIQTSLHTEEASGGETVAMVFVFLTMLGPLFLTTILTILFDIIHLCIAKLHQDPWSYGIKYTTIAMLCISVILFVITFCIIYF